MLNYIEVRLAVGELSDNIRSVQTGYKSHAWLVVMQLVTAV